MLASEKYDTAENAPEAAVPITKLHFVYNVEATPIALMKDFVHRIVDPATYPCRLCDITYGRFVKNLGWQRFVWGLPVASEFYTKDAFTKTYPKLADVRFPLVFAEDRSGRFSTFLSAADFDRIGSLEELKSEVEARLARPEAQASRRKTSRGARRS